nr:hypothetical protein [Tanacetum cinerariifolium]
MGTKSPGKDIDVYLRPLIDDLGTERKGYMACPTCNKDTPDVRALGKTAYVGHKRFLKNPHKLRRSLEFNDTAKAIQDLKRLGIRSGLCLGQTKNGKCSKPQTAYSFTPENRKSFQYLPDKVAKLIIKLCSFFKQICFATLMKDDMLKAQSKVVDILCNLELIYPPTFFDITIHLVIHLPLEALKAKPEGSIAEGYVAEEALTFSSYYFRDVTTKFNCLDRNVDPPPPNIPEIDTYLSEFKRFPRLVWVVGVSETSELFALACGPTPTPISVNSCLVNGVRFVVHSRDERRTTQNSGICSPGGKDKEMYYGDAFKDDQYILATQVKQCFYLKDMARRQHHWKVVEHVNHKKFSDEGVIIVDEDPNVIHFDNSSDLPLSTSLSDLDNATMHIDDLTYLDDEDLINVNDDDGVDMLADVTRGHGGDGGGDDRPPTHHIPTSCGGCFTNQGPIPIRFEWDNKKTMMPLSDHASHWSNYLGELIREMSLYYPSWQKVLAKRKAAILTKIGTRFDLKPHMRSQRWTDTNAGIQQHLQKLYNTNKASLKAAHWVINPETGTYDEPSLSRSKLPKPGKEHGRMSSRIPMESSSTREYPSLIHTFFVTHTVGGVFMRDEDRALYDEMLRLQRLGSNTETGVPYTEEEIMAIVQKGKQQGHLFGVGMVLSGCATGGSPPPPQSTVDPVDVEKLKKSNKSLTKQVKMMIRPFRSDHKFSQMLNLFESSPDFGGLSGCGDDEPGCDEEDEEDGNS